jgi:hypothetical protein
MLIYKRQLENKMRDHSLQKLKLKCRVSRTIHVVKVPQNCTKYVAKIKNLNFTYTISHVYIYIFKYFIQFFATLQHELSWKLCILIRMLFVKYFTVSHFILDLILAH